VVVLEIEMPSMKMPATAHIPGARGVQYDDITTTVGGVHSELPSVDHLAGVFARAGVSSGSTVVIYSQDVPMATRAFFSLTYLGNTRPALLLGGLAAWQAEGRPVSAALATATRGTLEAKPHPEIVAHAPWLKERLGNRSIDIIDTRTPGEYFGGTERHGAVSTGHIPGARLVEWPQLFSEESGFALRSPSELERLMGMGSNNGDTVVTYCTVGYRASVTYFVARYLGRPVKLYDGSYEEWSALGFPLTRDAGPRAAP
jgi:3-mercaptopyruvate sulfurtransferase SseA